jgi:hypothetical protein
MYLAMPEVWHILQLKYNVEMLSHDHIKVPKGSIYTGECNNISYKDKRSKSNKKSCNVKIVAEGTLFNLTRRRNQLSYTMLISVAKSSIFNNFVYTFLSIIFKFGQNLTSKSGSS